MVPVAAAATSASDGSSTASAMLPVDALTAARNAGLPIYEVGRTVVTHASKMGAVYATEYRRVNEVDDLSSPTTKFITVGAIVPDNFHVVRGSAYNRVRTAVVVNLRPVDGIFDSFTYDMTPQTWMNSPLVEVPGGGPSIGIALVR
ncbi:hypothetical protein EF834_13595 [Rhodococcus spongiicola]|uniref:Uncharacterized protein n=1 Tax=Rhodococcus spongiicola TaxID=2487352 RepID=A0A438ARY6_9NOCA|nr:hypothetical protein EF834_13595 [Rhodococcus spongiicola]